MEHFQTFPNGENAFHLRPLFQLTGAGSFDLDLLNDTVKRRTSRLWDLSIEEFPWDNFSLLHDF